MKRPIALLAVAALAIVTAVSAMAQTKAKGPNGGLVAGKGGHQTELVLSPAEVAVYILDHGKAHDPQGVKVKADIQDGGKTTSVDLASDGKKLVGKLAAPVGKGAVVVLTGKDDHGDVISARYVAE
jgi:hypothetical protein